MIGEIGCLDKKEPDFFCSALLSAEKGLEWEVLSADLKWRQQKNEETTADATVGSESGGGWVVAEKAEVEDAGP